MQQWQLYRCWKGRHRTDFAFHGFFNPYYRPSKRRYYVYSDNSSFGDVLSPIIQMSVWICTDVAMQISCFPRFFFLVALFARPAKIHHRQSRWLHEEKKWRHLILAPTWKATDHILTVIPPNRSKVFCLTQDGGRADFHDILGDHSFKEDLSKDTNFDPC